MTANQTAEISPLELKLLLENDANLFLLDVREPEEFEEAHLLGATHIPMMQVEEHLADIRGAASQADHFVVYCRSGGRSGMICQLLQDLEVGHPRNLTGGILAFQKL